MTLLRYHDVSLRLHSSKRMPSCFFPRLASSYQPCSIIYRPHRFFAFTHLPPTSRSAIPIFCSKGRESVFWCPTLVPHFKFRSFLPPAPTLVPPVVSSLSSRSQRSTERRSLVSNCGMQSSTPYKTSRTPAHTFFPISLTFFPSLKVHRLPASLSAYSLHTIIYCYYRRKYPVAYIPVASYAESPQLLERPSGTPPQHTALLHMQSQDQSTPYLTAL
jgi:hypothetical protein